MIRGLKQKVSITMSTRSSSSTGHRGIGLLPCCSPRDMVNSGCRRSVLPVALSSTV